MSETSLHRFPGGLIMTRQKSLTGTPLLADAEIPGHLIFPLLQRDGRQASPKVSIGEHVLAGTVLAGGDDVLDPPIHASTSGWVSAIEMRPIPHPSNIADTCIIITSDGQDLALPCSGLADYTKATAQAILQQIHAAGIVGQGGAGFPTAAKLKGNKPIHTLIINAAECEPTVSCDNALMLQQPADILGGADILRQVLGAQRVIIAIENDMPAAVNALLEIRSSCNRDDIEIVRVPTIYPAGGEKQLIQTLTGREVPTRGLPEDLGILCQNVATVAAIYRAVMQGEPLISRIVTVTGHGLHRPRNLQVRIGTPIAHLIDYCGGYTDQAARLIIGGPMMGYAIATDAVPISKTSHAVLVASPDELGAAPVTQPCIRCGACMEVCPTRLLPQQLHWHLRGDHLDRAADYQLLDCIECGCCDVVCPSHIPLTRQFQTAKGRLLAQQRERDKADHARVRFEARQQRMEQDARERAEVAQQRKASLAGGSSPHIQQALERARQKRASKPATPDESAD
ncbi:MAG: electron transport complex subunit RsxC [Methylococcaceae bacterium]|jgi:electron transport complex protein RnfC